MINKHVKDICKIGQGRDCCRYLVAGSDGFECAKLTSMKASIDWRVATSTMTAIDDNCDGYPTNKSIKILNDET